MNLALVPGYSSDVVWTKYYRIIKPVVSKIIQITVRNKKTVI